MNYFGHCITIQILNFRTLFLFFRIDASFVEGLRMFNIFCFLSDSVMLSCVSVSTTLPGRTMCQIDNQTPFLCKLLTQAKYQLQYIGIDNRLCSVV